VDGVIQEIRCVWNSKSNGHNATLWAPGFMLDDIEDVIEMVTKWLSIPVAAYLDARSPSHDYTQSASSFVKSKQGDIDVGAMFNNFPTHPSERHALGVRVINNVWNENTNVMNFGIFVSFILEGVLHLISRVNPSGLSLNYVRVIDIILRTIGSGKLCVLISQGTSTMTH
jgi:hypothetical protein